MKAPSFILIKRLLNTEARPPEPTLLQVKGGGTHTHTDWWTRIGGDLPQARR